MNDVARMFARTRRAAALLVAVAAAGCALRPLPPVDADVRTAARAVALPVEQVARGRALLVGACAACHAPIHPLDLELADWDDALPRMLRKADLGADAGAAVRAYVQVVHLAPVR